MRYPEFTLDTYETMTTITQESDGDIIIPIPEALAQAFGLHLGDAVFLTASGGKIIISKTADEYSLDDLLAGISDDNLHDETEL